MSGDAPEPLALSEVVDVTHDSVLLLAAALSQVNKAMDLKTPKARNKHLTKAALDIEEAMKQLEALNVKTRALWH